MDSLNLDTYSIPTSETSPVHTPSTPSSTTIADVLSPPCLHSSLSQEIPLFHERHFSGEFRRAVGQRNRSQSTIDITPAMLEQYRGKEIDAFGEGREKEMKELEIDLRDVQTVTSWINGTV